MIPKIYIFSAVQSIAKLLKLKYFKSHSSVRFSPFAVCSTYILSNDLTAWFMQKKTIEFAHAKCTLHNNINKLMRFVALLTLVKFIPATCSLRLHFSIIVFVEWCNRTMTIEQTKTFVYEHSIRRRRTHKRKMLNSPREKKNEMSLN